MGACHSFRCFAFECLDMYMNVYILTFFVCPAFPIRRTIASGLPGMSFGLCLLLYCMFCRYEGNVRS